MRSSISSRNAKAAWHLWRFFGIETTGVWCCVFFGGEMCKKSTVWLWFPTSLEKSYFTWYELSQVCIRIGKCCMNTLYPSKITTDCPWDGSLTEKQSHYINRSHTQQCPSGYPIQHLLGPFTTPFIAGFLGPFKVGPICLSEVEKREANTQKQYV